MTTSEGREAPPRESPLNLPPGQGQRRPISGDQRLNLIDQNLLETKLAVRVTTVVIAKKYDPAATPDHL